MSFRIATLWAFVSVGEDGDEGLVAQRIEGTWIPFVCGDVARVETFRRIVAKLARETGTKIRLVKFAQRIDVETIGGGG